MTIERKVGMGIAGQPTGPDPDVAEVFSAHEYTGTAASQSINNGIDLAGEGGIVWLKNRSSAANHRLVSPDISPTGASDYYLTPNLDNAKAGASDLVSSFNSNGFSLNYGYSESNQSSEKYVSWTFRKAPKFFDVVTWTGDGLDAREISHNLAGPVGMILAKCTSNGGLDWIVYHKGNNGGTNPEDYHLNLNLNSALSTSAYWSDTAPTSSSFTVGASTRINGDTKTYVAYVFADNSTEATKKQMIRCGTFSKAGGVNPIVDLGWEPQWLLVKRAESGQAGDWDIFDSSRRFLSGGSGTKTLKAETDNAEDAYNFNVTSTGFEDTGSTGDTTATYIYCAIRAPMMKEPTAGTDVYNAVERTGTNSAATVVVNFAPDLVINRRNDDGENGDAETWDRLRGRPAMISTNSVNVETLYGNAIQDLVSFNSTGISLGLGTYAQINYSNRQNIIWFFKRAKGFFDIVCYTGNATAGRTVSHNLGAKPQLILAKTRNAANYWVTYDEASGATKHMRLDDGGGSTASIDHWNNTEPTSSVITLGDGNYTNRNSTKQIMYMFASVEGVSKVGSYTGTGSQQTIDCGFSNGARFVLTKCTTHNVEWMVHDTTRGIVSGNDKRLTWSTTNPQVGSSDEIDPHSSGFILDTQGDMNLSGRTYIFLAIA